MYQVICACAIEEAAGAAEFVALRTGSDLVVLNKFGLSEAEWRGFREMILEAVKHGVPVLIGVSQTQRAAFERLSASHSVDLRAEAEIVFHWCRSAIHLTQASTEAWAKEILT
ncbi:MAG: DUF2478 domain-containing protein [Marivivens sp.]|jgi:uncharacterized membrane protein